MCLFMPCIHNQLCMLFYWSTVVSPYVGMARKQNGGYNASVQTLIFHLVVNSASEDSYICSPALPQLNSGTKIARKRC